MASAFFSRDISWLSFNRRVLQEAANMALPPGERFKFISIYSSNLDEFYLVRIPVLIAKQNFVFTDDHLQQQALSELEQAKNIIQHDLDQFGNIVTTQLIPLLQQHNIHWVYREAMPEILYPVIENFFLTTLAAFIQVNYLKYKADFFPENNKLYLVVALEENGEALAVVNIPSDETSRFLSIDNNGIQYIIFIDDIIRFNLHHLFGHKKITGCYSFKVTRDADIDLEDELPGELAEKIEKEIAKRELGVATRLLYEPGIALRQLYLLSSRFKISPGNAIAGGVYHNMKDVINLPLDKSFFYPKQTPVKVTVGAASISKAIRQRDILINPPYHNYDTVLRFFNEAAIDNDVEEIFVTMYRIAEDSRIAHALISAAKNGKKVHVFVELKARFDEANNIRWGKKMKDAGVKVIYSIPKLKVHAKIALIKNKKHKHIGLLATGNLNESTARFYTDHVLLTAHKGMLQEMEQLFGFLSKRKKPGSEDSMPFKHLLVAQFNLQQKFIELIDREINNANNGLPASILVKLNNLEEQTLINKLYEASNAGVQVRLIIRSICCLIPGVKGMSGNITVKRIVGRYLEHGRVFVFHNNGNEEVYAGSADWMNRNIYTRIEVCFPVYDVHVKNTLRKILELQWQNNVQAVYIDNALNNVPVEKPVDALLVNAQEEIYALLEEEYLNTENKLLRSA